MGQCSKQMYLVIKWTNVIPQGCVGVNAKFSIVGCFTDLDTAKHVRNATRRLLSEEMENIKLNGSEVGYGVFIRDVILGKVYSTDCQPFVGEAKFVE